MKKHLLTVGMALVAGVAVAGNALLSIDTASEEQEFTGRAVINDQEDGSKAFLVEKRVIITSKKSFEIDPAKTYRLSVRIKTLGDKPSLVYLGVAPHDAQGRYIASEHAIIQSNTMTELAAPCEAGDTVIKVKDASKWNTSPRAMAIAFDVQEDESDLPNRKVSPAIERFEEKDGVYEVTLVRAVGAAYPAGTKIRQHRMGGYVYAKSGRVPGEWTEWTGNLRGSSLRMGKTGKLVLLCNWGDSSEQSILFDKLTIEEVK